MFKYILLCSLLAHTIWAKPVHQHHAELAPHVLIVTPQAQLRLESLVPGTPLIQHLSPFTRFITPHEETIVYVPASAAAAIQNAEIVARSLEDKQQGKQWNPQDLQNNLNAIASNTQTNLQNAATTAIESANNYIAGSTSFSPTNPLGNLQTAAEAVFQGAQSAASSYITAVQSAQQPPATPQAQTQLLAADAATEISLPPIIAEQKLPLISTAVSLPPLIATEQKPLISLGTKIPTLTSLLSPSLPAFSIYTNEPRHHYVVSPTTQHIIDYVPGSILLTPTIKARRSILPEEKEEKPIAPLILAEPVKPSTLPLINELEKEELLLKEKKEEFKRFLEANALKETAKEEKLELKADIKPIEEEKVENLKIDLAEKPQELKLTEIEADKPQTKEA